MDCVMCRDNLSAYIENELMKSEQEQIDDHMSTCAPCLAEYKSLNQTHQLVTDNIMIKASPALWTRIEAQIGATASKAALSAPAPPQRSFLSWLGLEGLWNPMVWRVGGGALAALSLALGLVYFTHQQQEKYHIEQAMHSYVQERDQVEKTHNIEVKNRDMANTDEYEENPFIIENRHAMDNPFKL